MRCSCRRRCSTAATSPPAADAPLAEFSQFPIATLKNPNLTLGSDVLILSYLKKFSIHFYKLSDQIFLNFIVK